MLALLPPRTSAMRRDSALAQWQKSLGLSSTEHIDLHTEPQGPRPIGPLASLYRLLGMAVTFSYMFHVRLCLLCDGPLLVSTLLWVRADLRALTPRGSISSRPSGYCATRTVRARCARCRVLFASAASPISTCSRSGAMSQLHHSWFRERPATVECSSTTTDLARSQPLPAMNA